MSASPRRRTSRWYHDPFVRWTTGRSFSSIDPEASRDRTRTADTARALQGLSTQRGRGADLRALAGGRRVRAGRCRLGGRSRPAAVHDHPAAAERDRFAAPRPCPADRGRGPHGPPRTDARPPDAVPAGPRPRQHRRPVRPRRYPRQGRGEPPDARPGTLPRADARVLRLDQARDARPAAPRRRIGRLGPAALHDGRRVGTSRAGRLRAAVPRGSGLSHRGAHQLVSRLPDERQRPGGRVVTGDGDAVVDPLPPLGRGDRGA